ncbi:type I inositol polyphosphate 5-phosphatase 1-like isoform X2 [Impatiens glandulifera]|uniref:type I inositol polyphosphate 5-phosphatase 1-like isoform X2 n=1 Tax=Impatiens glandulifera TaxID=253017 RepID=UPI001FB14039|nr:type I inositol polyphosphate 5-phosphatase 1-like isoform X2 [Impatiens glandulifera]
MKAGPIHKHRPERTTWADICFGCTCLQLLCPKLVVRKWLNISDMESDYSADTDDESDSAIEDSSDWQSKSRLNNSGNGDGADIHPTDAFPRLRRRNSETHRAQFMKTKETKVCIATWNLGGKPPPDDLDIEGWLDTTEPADMYVIGFQEIVPLNAGNIFGTEDTRPLPKWENIIRETLNRTRPMKPFKSYSDPPSPSRFKRYDEVEDEIMIEVRSHVEDDIFPLHEESNDCNEEDSVMITSENGCTDPEASVSCDAVNTDIRVPNLERKYSSSKKLSGLNCLTDDCKQNLGLLCHPINQIKKSPTGTERVDLVWPEPPLDLLVRHVLQRPNSFKSIKAFKSFRKRRSSFVRILSKQMVGVFLTIWVHRSLRKHIRNVKVSTVGVGVMGYIGNKGSISVSMSIYQTFFCFICTHLTSGERDIDAVKRNADVLEIHRRSQFHSISSVGFPKSIHEHERIIWFGDLNYRINLPYERTRELISKEDWSKLAESDELTKELKGGGVFDGWSEGTVDFPPTYKYEFNSDKYYGEDPNNGRRTPAWCDRILSYGSGIKLLSYRRTEHTLSDHRPVTASFMVDVEACCPRKLQRALTITDAEMEDQGM